MSVADRVIGAMEPGVRHDVVSLSQKIHEDYAATFFALERLVDVGFVYAYEDNLFSLTEFGVKLHRILSTRD